MLGALSRSRAESSVFNATQLAVAAIVVAGALLRFVGLEHQSFESDELVTLSLVHKSFSGMLARIPHSEATPPVYYVLVWAWTHVVGRSDAGLRSMSALFGTATVPVSYLVGRAMLRSRSGGLIVAALLAVAPVMIWYSQEARSYALFVFFGALSLLYFARSLDAPSRTNLGGWAVWSSFAIATHYFAGFLVLAETILLLRRLRRRFAPALAFVLVVTAALAPLAYHQYRGAGAKWAWFKRANPGSRLHELLERFFFFNYNPGRTPLLVLAVIVAAVLALRGRRVARAPEALLVGGISVVVPFVLVFAGIDVFEYRNLLVAWLPFAVAVAAGIATLPGSARVATATVAALALLGCTLMISRRVDLQRGSWRAGATVLESIPGPRVVMPTQVSLLYHYWPVQNLPRRGVRVAEVDVIGQGIGSVSSLHLDLPGFRMVEKTTAGNMTILRLRAPSRKLVTPADLPWRSVAVDG